MWIWHFLLSRSNHHQKLKYLLLAHKQMTKTTSWRQNSSITRDGELSIQCNLNREAVELQRSDWPNGLTIPFIWLRSHCQCTYCFDQGTMQRTQGINPSWLCLRPDRVTANNETLQIQWTDGHETTYDCTWLRAHSYERRSHSPWIDRSLWGGAQFPLSVAPQSVSYEKLLVDEGAVAQLVGWIMRFGVGCVAHVPPTKSATRKAIERVCALQKTFWGEMHELQADGKEDDMAYGMQALAPHTDCNYLFEAPGIQIFHVLEATPQGGETLLVDGFHVARELRRSRPDAYRTLATAPVQFEFRDRVRYRFYKNTDIVLTHEPLSQQLWQVRFSPNDLSPISTLAPGATDGLCEALALFQSLLTDPAHQGRLSLRPGSLLFVDNWRVLHGRTAFSGRRVIVGGYLSRSDFLNRARTLGVISDLY